MTNRVKTFWTIFITGSIAVLLPIGMIKVFRVTMAPMITRDNANITFTEFQNSLEHGDTIRDPITAASVADSAYRKKSNGILLDGWGNRMHIYAVVQGNSCELNIQSAGPDGEFGDSDDVTIQHSFDLAPQIAATTKTTQP